MVFQFYLTLFSSYLAMNFYAPIRYTSIIKASVRIGWNLMIWKVFGEKLIIRGYYFLFIPLTYVR